MYSLGWPWILDLLFPLKSWDNISVSPHLPLVLILLANCFFFFWRASQVMVTWVFCWLFRSTTDKNRPKHRGAPQSSAHSIEPFTPQSSAHATELFTPRSSVHATKLFTPQSSAHSTELLSDLWLPHMLLGTSSTKYNF